MVGALSIILGYLSDPKDSAALAGVYRVWRREEREDAEQAKAIDGRSPVNCAGITHDRGFPLAAAGRLAGGPLSRSEDNPALYEHLIQFRALVRRWQRAADLPVDQMVLTIGARSVHAGNRDRHGLQCGAAHAPFRRSAPGGAFAGIHRGTERDRHGQRGFSGIGDDDDAFDPEQHKGQVTVTTMHKAKGLEWDRVYIMSANNYDYPSADPFDTLYRREVVYPRQPEPGRRGAGAA